MKTIKKIIRQFEVTVEIKEKVIYYDFKAIVKPSYDSPYRIEIITRGYVEGKMKSYSNAELYFDDAKEMIKEFEYYYKRNKENLFTKKIIIKK